MLLVLLVLKMIVNWGKGVVLGGTHPDGSSLVEVVVTLVSTMWLQKGQSTDFGVVRRSLGGVTIAGLGDIPIAVSTWFGDFSVVVLGLVVVSFVLCLGRVGFGVLTFARWNMVYVHLDQAGLLFGFHLLSCLRLRGRVVFVCVVEMSPFRVSLFYLVDRCEYSHQLYINFAA